ncbi:ATP-binding protein [Halopiger goleimassiliensis]|uniref:ATP-binding protein n=1 Tax=Halopiger goleimassiliensis TaxID=1293048 RepID=UPI0009DBC911|nr:ATP-binding protein [Halopiger goleimassiliensis]
MTNITDLRISGFKGLGDLKYDPNRINIITGRNNTGKTSVLESIDLAFNPTSINRFSDNINKVINANEEYCTISVKYTQEQQTLLDDFSEPKPESNHREMGIQEPRKQEAIDIFIESLQEIIEVNERYPIRLRGNIRPDLSEDEKLTEVMQDVLTETVTEMSENIPLPAAENNTIIMDVDGDEYAYIHLGEYYEEIRNHIVSEASPKILDKIIEEDPSINELEEKELDRLRHDIRRGLNNQLVPRFGADRFVGDEPEPVDGVRMVDSPILEAEDVDMSQENAAVRVSDIEDYLVTHNILENLEDFSFDKLVFKEDDGKYEIPYSFMGDGFRTIVGILWEVLSNNRRGNVLLLEEPDVHMHPGYIESLLTQLVKIVREKDLQIFITTHNSDMIEGFFSQHLKAKEEDFLSDNFKLLQLTEPVPRSLSYERAEEEVEELNIDLRGI